jgi:hypothetical protein
MPTSNYHFFYLFNHKNPLFQFALCSDCLLGYNHLLYAKRLLGYNLVKSGTWLSLFMPLRDAAPLFLPLHGVTLLFLPLHDASRISTAPYCYSYCCHSVLPLIFLCSVVSRIHSSVDICEQRHAPTI